MSESIVLTFPTTFAVLQAEGRFKEIALAHRLRPTPRGLPSRCGLSIEVAEPAMGTAVAALREANLAVDGAARPSGDGNWTAVELPSA